jgi:hypothetical protein
MVRLTRPHSFNDLTLLLLVHPNRILDALHLALTIGAVYTYIVTGFGSLAGLEHIVWCVPHRI